MRHEAQETPLGWWRTQRQNGFSCVWQVGSAKPHKRNLTDLREFDGKMSRASLSEHGVQ